MTLGTLLGIGAALPAAGFDPLARGTAQLDLVYASPGGVEVRMDIRYPRSRGPWPCVVAVHGGGWSEGDKAGFHLGLAERGYLVASINYRMYPAFRFPAMIEDVKSALRFLRARAAEFNLDPDRIALLGHSAGGHLAALAALAGREAGWDVGENLDHSSEARAVIVLAGPADLRMAFPSAGAETLRFTVFEPSQWETASPVSWVRAGAPPFLVIHGEADDVVPIEQGMALADALRGVGASAEFVPVRRAGHGFEAKRGFAWPPIPLLMAKALGFLERNLR